MSWLEFCCSAALANINPKVPSLSHPPVYKADPEYEEVSATDGERNIGLRENIVSGPEQKIELRENVAYGPVN